MQTDAIDKLFLELSQITRATTKREIVMKEALEKLARLGNEPHYGNSKGNIIAIAALQKISSDLDCRMTTES